MNVFDFFDIDDDKIPSLFQNGIKDLEVDELDLDIFKAFYYFKFNNPETPQILFSDIAQYLTQHTFKTDNVFIFRHFYTQVEKRASRLIHLPFILDLNSEIDAILNKGEDIETINFLKQYREDGGSGIFECNFIQASIDTITTTDGSTLSFFWTHQNPFDDLFFKALNFQGG